MELARSRQENELAMKRHAIYMILVLAFVIRLYNVNSPILGYHSWRQADTAAIARNFYEHGYNLFYPQIDWGGGSAGYVETEFQIYPFVVAAFYKMFGVREFLGRFLSLAFSLVAIYALYLLVRKYINQGVALWAALVFSIIPLNVHFSRAFMPESALIMCSVLGVYLFSQWITCEKWRYFFLSATFIGLACLIKIPTLYLGLPLLYLAWIKFDRRTFAQWPLWLYGLLIFIPVGLWYYHAHQVFLEYGLTFGIWEYGTDKWGNWELLLTSEFYNRILFKSIAERHLTWAGFVAFVIGLFIKRTSREERVFDFWLISIVIYFLIVAKGNQVHEYYQLPFVIPAAVFVGKTFSRYFSYSLFKKSSFARRLVIGCVALCAVCIPILGCYRYYRYVKAEDLNSPTYRLAQKVQQKTEKDALIMAVDNSDPTLLYLSHRKGWLCSADDIDDVSIAKRKHKGAKYIVGEKRHYKNKPQREKISELLGKYHVIVSTDDYFIVELR